MEDKLFFWDGKEFYEVDRVNSDGTSVIHVRIVTFSDVVNLDYTEYVSTKYSMWTVFPDLSLIAPFALKDYPSYIFILCTPRKPKRTICYQLNIGNATTPTLSPPSNNLIMHAPSKIPKN